MIGESFQVENQRRSAGIQDDYHGGTTSQGCPCRRDSFPGSGRDVPRMGEVLVRDKGVKVTRCSSIKDAYGNDQSRRGGIKY